MVARGTVDPQSNNLVCGPLVTPSPTYRRAKSGMCYGNWVDSPEAHPLGLCQIPGLLAGQFDSWPKSSSDLHFSEQAIVWKAQRLSQKTCKKIPCRGSGKSPQLKCNPEEVDLCSSEG